MVHCACATVPVHNSVSYETMVVDTTNFPVKKGRERSGSNTAVIGLKFKRGHSNSKAGQKCISSGTLCSSVSLRKETFQHSQGTVL